MSRNNVLGSFGTNTGDSISSSGGGGGCQGTVTVVRAFLVFCDGACSDNVGNKESKVGIFSFNGGINLSRFPIVKVVKEVFSFIPNVKYSYNYGT